MCSTEKRPDLQTVQSRKEFERWYWLKEELVAYCKERGLPASGNKIEVADRIKTYLETGTITKAMPRKARTSSFNWAREPLSIDTVITDTVTFGKNFRGFMQAHIGKKFVCHSDFMDWVKSNSGKTLGDAVDAWYALEDRKKDPSFERTIAPQNMLAQYTRDFFADNPEKTHAEMLACWKIKKTLPHSGRVVYEPSDLKLASFRK